MLKLQTQENEFTKSNLDAFLIINSDLHLRFITGTQQFYVKIDTIKGKNAVRVLVEKGKKQGVFTSFDELLTALVGESFSLEERLFNGNKFYSIG